MRRTFIALMAFAVLIAACGKSEEPTTTTSAATSTTSTSTSTTLATTTTTEDTRPRSPINGLPVDDPTLLDRRVIAVKIDNHWDARPQSGIQDADAVAELRVEGGLTRFMAIFHVKDTDYLGPIRSGRPADAKVAIPLNATLFISGAQGWVQQGLRDLGVTFFVDPRPGMFRISSRFAPHNLYGDTTELRQFATDAGVPDSPPPSGLWAFGDLPATAKPATVADVTFSNDSTVHWEWDAATRKWLRFVDDEPSNWVDKDGNETQISADTLVMIEGRYYIASGSTGSAVPATDTVGEGNAWVFAGGKVMEGTWSRSDAKDPFEFKDASGNPFDVPPGLPWISIVPDVGGVEVS
jgi:hypothetical protein